MSREWKPGDVAVVTSGCGEPPVLAFRDGDRSLTGWSLADYRRGAVWIEHNDGLDVRPLVVIDPEDREQVERLAAIMLRGQSVIRDPRAGEVDIAQAALREFANPPPPQCTAALIVKGEHFYCDSEAGHGLPHGNSAAEAIWGEQP